MRIVFNLIFILDYNSFHIIKHKNIEDIVVI